MKLRDYQTDAIQALRDSLKNNRSSCLAMPTGSGKTATFVSITERAFKRQHRIWIIVPRNELMTQASEHLTKYNTPHGKIAAGKNESRAYRVHLVSKDTLTRRWDRIKHWPDLVIIDECHLNLTFQINLIGRLPAHTKIIGFSATPERLDGRGLSTTAGGVYDALVHGPTIQDLVERGYLTNVRYFCPPVEGLDTLHRKGTEFDADELDLLLKKRAIYGKAIEHYRRYADKKPTLVYCRSVKSAYDTAHRFRDAGYRFECIEGNMDYGKRKILIDGLSSGKLHGLTSVDITTYGLDIPRVECIIMLRPTLSRALYSQMIGRGLRPYTGKKECVILDHVNNLVEHGHPLGHHDWRFDGIEKQSVRKGTSADTLRLCEKCFLYYEGSTCPNCGNTNTPKPQEGLEEVDGRLVEIQPVPMQERPPEQQRVYQERINEAVDKCEKQIDSGAVGTLLKVAEDLDRSPMWVYWLLSDNMRAVNIPLLYEIARQKGYKSGWVWYKRKDIEKKLRSVV